MSYSHSRLTDLNGVLVGEEVDDLECMCNDADSHKLLAVVASLHHQTTVMLSIFTLV
jgi:hypothetical protein